MCSTGDGVESYTVTVPCLNLLRLLNGMTYCLRNEMENSEIRYEMKKASRRVVYLFCSMCVF